MSHLVNPMLVGTDGFSFFICFLAPLSAEAVQNLIEKPTLVVSQ
jgi:hypothetical protein